MTGGAAQGANWAPGRTRSGAARLLVAGGAPDVVHHDVRAPFWALPPLRVAMLSDIHVAEPWMGLRALGRIVARVNALGADIVLLLGDYITGLPVLGWRPDVRTIAAGLARLRAPLGVHVILGNHDWKDDRLARATGFRRAAIAEALTEAGLPPLVNAARRVPHGDGLWLVGLDSQQGEGNRRRDAARHDPEAAFAAVPRDATVLTLAHEPDWFAERHPQAPIVLSGHTHGGQANLFGWRPLTPSRFGGRYAYGHVVEEGRHLIVSGGAGYTLGPLRIAQPPEITTATFRRG